MDSKKLILLTNLYRILSPSHQEGEMSKFIQSHLKSLKVPFKVDSIGQIYSINPGTPLLSSHMDQVQKKAPTSFHFDGDMIYGFNDHRQCGLGGDDKNGIFIILSILEMIDPSTISFVFSSGEEAGGKIGQVPLGDHPYCIVLDRKGSGDIIGVSNSYCCQDLEDAISEVGKDFGYAPARGMFSDADCISKSTATVNLSIGYYSAHTDYEYTNLRELENSLKFTKKIIDTIPQVKYDIPIKPVFTPNSWWGSGKYGKDLKEDWDSYDSWVEGKMNKPIQNRLPYTYPYDDNPSEDLVVTIKKDKAFLYDSVENLEFEIATVPRFNEVIEVDYEDLTILLSNLGGDIVAHLDYYGEYSEITVEVE